MVHGGAGALNNINTHREAVRYLESVRVVLEHGRGILLSGGTALEAVEQCASLLEDDPLFNAGAGSVLNEDGNRAKHEGHTTDVLNAMATAFVRETILNDKPFCLYLSFKATTPGSCLPSRSSKEAPPPVEM